MPQRITVPDRLEDEFEYDISLRPTQFDEFVGQEKIKENLSIFIQAARKRGEPLDHVLFYGPPGLGKTTLAHIIAREMEANIKSTSGPVLERPAELAGLLTNMGQKEVLFIDEIHRINHVVEEYLYPAMEDFKIDIMIEKGPSARSVKIDLQPFTLVGATTRAGLLTTPLRARSVQDRLEVGQDLRGQHRQARRPRDRQQIQGHSPGGEPDSPPGERLCPGQGQGEDRPAGRF